jgi:hypothetical protein
MKPGGVPDETRAGRLILKDFVTGKLLLCKAPPEADQGTVFKLRISRFAQALTLHAPIQNPTKITFILSDNFSKLSNQTEKRPAVVFDEVDDISLEESFPELRMTGAVHVRDRGKKQRGPVLIGSNNDNELGSSKKHGNKKKREKIRRLYTEPTFCIQKN